MKKRKVKIAVKFAELDHLSKLKRAMEIANAITAHKDVFKHPDPTPLSIKKMVEAIETELALSSDSKMHSAEMNRLFSLLDGLITDMAHYVEKIAANDESIVGMSSFELRKLPTRPRTDFDVYLPNNPGTVGLRCRRQDNTIYIWQYCKGVLNNNNFVEALRTNKASAIIGNLDSGVPYWFKVILFTTDAQPELGPKGIMPL